MPIQLHQMKTMLATGDMDATIVFYRDVLGFTLGDKFESSGEISFCEMALGDASIMFTTHETSTNAPGASETFAQTSIVLYVGNVEAVYEVLVDKGIQVSALRVTFYGMKEFDFQDPTGYTILIGQPTQEAPTIEGENDAPF